VRAGDAPLEIDGDVRRPVEPEQAAAKEPVVAPHAESVAADYRARTGRPDVLCGRA